MSVGVRRRRASCSSRILDYLLGSVHFIDGLAVDGKPRCSTRSAWRGLRLLRDAGGGGAQRALRLALAPDLVKVFGGERAASSIRRGCGLDLESGSGRGVDGRLEKPS